MIKVFERFEHLMTPAKGQKFETPQAWLDSLMINVHDHPFSYAYYRLHDGEYNPLLIMRKAHHNKFVRRMAYIMGDEDDLLFIQQTFPEWSPCRGRRSMALKKAIEAAILSCDQVEVALAHYREERNPWEEEFAGDIMAARTSLWRNLVTHRWNVPYNDIPFPEHVFPPVTTP